MAKHTVFGANAGFLIWNEVNRVLFLLRVVKGHVICSVNVDVLKPDIKLLACYLCFRHRIDFAL